MNLEAWASLWSAAGTVAAAGVAAYSARLAWRQVGYQFVPRLIIRADRFQVRTTSSLQKDFWWTKPGDEARYVNGGSENYVFTILNVGNGPAFDVRVYAEFDYSAVYSDVMDKLKPFFPELNLKHDEFGCQVRMGDTLIGGFRLPDQAFAMIEAVGGAATADRQQTFRIDPNLSFFTTCYAHYLRAGHETVEDARHAQTIPITFRIEYLDGSANRQSVSTPMRLSVAGGRYLADGSDGVSIIDLSNP